MTRPFQEPCHCGAGDCRWCRPWDITRYDPERASCELCRGARVVEVEVDGKYEMCLSCDGRGWVPVVSESTEENCK